jgi:hypothetical protein
VALDIDAQALNTANVNPWTGPFDLAVSLNTSQPNDLALGCVAFAAGFNPTITQPDASWTVLEAIGVGLGSGIFWKNVPAAGAVSIDGSFSPTAPPDHLVALATLLTFKTLAAPVVRNFRSSTLSAVPSGTPTPLAFISNLLANSALFVIMGQGTDPNPIDFQWAITDSQNNLYTELISAFVSQANQQSKKLAVYATPSASAGACTVSATQNTGGNVSSGFAILEVGNLALKSGLRLLASCGVGI